MIKNNTNIIEKQVGIKTFLTKTDGINGKLRLEPEDFTVEEIPDELKENNQGKFVIAKVTAINWETNLLVRELSNRLKISRKRISFAGTKDKRAKTTQTMSFYNISKQELSEIKIKDVEITNINISEKPIKLGDLKGNIFEINIRNIEPKNHKEKIKKITDLIKKNKGFPNFYGIQRFGTIRPITHIVGKNIIKGDFKSAVMCYIANPFKEENESIYKLRKELEETKDYANALKNYPNYLIYEKSILNKLVEKPDDYISALKELPNTLLTMFIHAYQSYLFNEILSKRIIKEISINKAIKGDIIFPIKNNKIQKNTIKVNKYNIEKVNKQIEKRKAVVTALLFGSKSKLTDGLMGEIERDVLKKEKIDKRNFIVPEIPFISSYGTRRPIIAYINEIKYHIKEDTKNKNIDLNLRFQLSKGCYATSLLREYMKSDDITNY